MPIFAPWPKGWRNLPIDDTQGAAMLQCSARCCPHGRRSFQRRDNPRYSREFICELQNAQHVVIFSHLRNGGLASISNLPFRHPLPKLPGPAGNGRAFFLPIASLPLWSGNAPHRSARIACSPVCIRGGVILALSKNREHEERNGRWLMWMRR